MQVDKPFYSFPLSEHMEQTPEGFLLCFGVPISAAGELEYLDREAPGVEAVNGRVTIRRTLEDILRPETIASAEGKPITFKHPSILLDGGFVKPETAKYLTVGHVQNVRPGTGDQAEKLVCDLMITDAEAIKAVMDRTMREVSPGFDRTIVQETPGTGRFTNIVFNHVALVETGRAGPELAIQDSKPNPEAGHMATFMEGLKKVFGKTLDAPMPAEGEPPKKGADPADALAQVLAESSQNKADMIALKAGLAEVMTALKTLLADEEAEKALAAKAEQDKKTADEAAKAEADKVVTNETAGGPGAVAEVKEAVAADACATHDSATISAAEIVAPGVDLKDKSLIKTALARGMTTDAAPVISRALAGATLDSLSDREARLVLFGVSATLTEQRTKAAGRGMTQDAGTSPAILDTPAKHNAFFAKLRNGGK